MHSCRTQCCFVAGDGENGYVSSAGVPVSSGKFKFPLQLWLIISKLLPKPTPSYTCDHTTCLVVVCLPPSHRVHWAAPTGGKTVTVTSSYMLVTQDRR